MDQISQERDINIKQIDLAFELIQGISNLNYEYIYRGKFTKNITMNLLSLLETNLEKSGDTHKFKKKIYFVMVECLQNITKHQDKIKNTLGDESAILFIQKTQKKYYITTGNIIENSNITKLTSQLEKVNSLSQDELKTYYQEMLINGEISTKGGAGLGLIAMARKTGNKLVYDFQKVNEKISYFYLKTEILLTEEHENDDCLPVSFGKIKSLHEIVIEEDILLNFNGTFDKDNLISLLPIVDDQVQGPLDFKKKVFKIMYEMLHNIVNYSEDFSSIDKKMGQNQGIFLLSKKNDTYYFTAGNYLHFSKVKILKDKIDFVNNQNEAQLHDFYKKLSAYFLKEEIKKPDLSIIEMKLKSGNPLNYKFTDFTPNHSFFTIQATLLNSDE
jgi:hypothetical protein